MKNLYGVVGLLAVIFTLSGFMVTAKAYPNDSSNDSTSKPTSVSPSKPGATEEAKIPYIAHVEGSPTLNQVKVFFSAAMDASSAQMTGNYSIAGLNIIRATLQPDSRTVVLDTSIQIAGAAYTLVVSGVADLHMINVPVSLGTKAFHAFVLGIGGLRNELYHGNITNVADIRLDPRYPNNPTLIVPLSRFENSWPEGMYDNSGNRVSGYFVPKETAEYIFYSASDDDCIMYMSRDDRPENLEATPFLSSTNRQQWRGYWDLFDRKNGSGVMVTNIPRSFEAGKAYYFEYFVHNRDGEHHFNVAVRKANEAPPGNGDPPIPGDMLGGWVNPDNSTLTILPQPSSIYAMPFQDFSFHAAAIAQWDLGTNILCQWYRNNIKIPGATSSVYTLRRVWYNEHNSVYACLMTIPGITNVSGPIRLTVWQDIATPQIVEAYGMGDTLTLNFNAPVIEITNYTLSSGLISQAEIVDSGYSALLTVTGMVDQSFNILLPGIYDTMGNHWDSITGHGIYNHLQSSDIHDSKATSGDGYLSTIGKAVPLSNKDFDISGSGNGIQGTQDACQFVYEPWQGDFDAIVKVESLEPTGRWAKAGIMFRESLDPKSKCIWVSITPQGPLTLDPVGRGLDQYETGTRLNHGGFTGDWPTAGLTNAMDVHYPNAWIHIRRIHTDTSDRYIASRSDDGVHWTLMQTTELTGQQALASQGYLGLFVTSQDSYPGTDLTHVKFRQYFPVIPLDWGWPMPNLANLRAVSSAGNLEVSWRNEAGAMILQSTTNLKSNAGDSDWQDINANIPDDGTNKTWRINNPGNNLFFRLIYK